MKSDPVRYPIKMRMKAYLMDRGYGTAGQLLYPKFGFGLYSGMGWTLEVIPRHNTITSTKCPHHRILIF